MSRKLIRGIEVRGNDKIRGLEAVKQEHNPWVMVRVLEALKDSPKPRSPKVSNVV